jgi:DNA processing protein
MVSDAAYLLALTSLDGIGPILAMSLVKRFTTPDQLESAQQSDLDEALGKHKAGIMASQLRNGWHSLLARSQARVDKHLETGIHPIAITDAAYPPLLKCIPDPPPVLYAKGDIQILKVLDCVAVVGTRNPTPKGEQVASSVSSKLAAHGFIIVSGLALGIDAAAHQAACQDGYTIAVLANPLDTIYPAKNKKLADRILKTHGLLVGELALGDRTYPQSFVRRDRIQSGLSLAVIPVQTDIEGGTMHTVRFAEEQKRLLFCPTPLEGEKDKSQYAGIRELIRTNRAKAFQSKDDYPEIVSQLRDHKAKLILEHGLTDTPLPPRPEPTKPSEAELALAKHEALVQELETKLRDSGFANDKRAFNAIISKLRTKLFGKKAKNKEDSQQRLLE